MVHNPTQKIYKINVPREYILPYLDKNKYGELKIPNDIMLIELLDAGKTIGESITLVSHNSLLPVFTEKVMCKRYFNIAKRYIHEYNLEKKKNKHNKETT